MRLSHKVPVHKYPQELEKIAMKFEKLGDNQVKIPSSKGDKWYYISIHGNPVIEDSEDPLIMCSCPDFTIGRPKELTNPFKYPCKHIRELKRWAGHESMCTTEDVLEDISKRNGRIR